MELDLQINALRELCTLILCGYNEAVFNRCKGYLKNPSDEYGGVPSILYVFSGDDIDDDDPFGNIAEANEQLVKPQYYFISSDAGAPDLQDFFWFIENLKTARGLDFAIDKKKFSNDDSIVEWLGELSGQLEDLYILDFDGAGEDYHFTILDKSDCEKARDLFKKMTSHIEEYKYDSFIITEDFQG